MSLDLDAIVSLGSTLVRTVEGWIASARAGNEQARDDAARRLRHLAGALALLDESEAADRELAIREVVERARADTPVLGVPIPIAPPLDDP